MEVENNNLVTKCSGEKFVTLVHGIIDRLLRNKGPQYEVYSEEWSLEEWWQVQDLLEDLSRQCGKESCQREQITRIAAVLPETHRDLFLSAVLIREDDLHQAALSRTQKISGTRLKDFDWKLKLALSSDKLASVHEPLLSLDLDIDSTKGNKALSLELNKQELDQLITSLEAANKAVQQLKT